MKKKNSVFIISNECETTSHGTTITIRDVTKRIDAPRTICKIREVLESMYRRDILSGDVEIIFNGEELSFKEYEALSFRKRVWKKEVSFDVVFRDRNYKVNGFVGILNNGSFSRAGFALFRRGRVVIGGDDMNYKPHDIYGQSQSPISHKLYGELDLEDFEINQAKDGFVWDDGLEDEFISKLKENIQEYIDIAKLTNKERAKEIEFSESTSDEIQHNVSELLATVPFDISITDPIKNASPINEDIPPHANDLDAYKQAILPQAEPSVPFTVAKPREYNVQLNSVTTIKLLVKWEIGQKTKWISVNDTINEIEITININHPFFKPYSEEKEFKEVLEKFVIAFVLAEREAKITSTEKGMILESSIQTNLNKFLERFSK